MNSIVNDVLKSVVPMDLFSAPTNIPFNMPLNPLGHVDAISTVLPGGGFNLLEYLSPKGSSPSDLAGILKGVALLSIQIFIIVVKVVWQIVRGILEAVNS